MNRKRYANEIGDQSCGGIKSYNCRNPEAGERTERTANSNKQNRFQL